MKPKVNRPIIITCLFIGIFLTFINLMRCIFEFDASAVCYFVSTLFGVLTFIVLLEYDFDKEELTNQPTLLECIKEWNEKGFDVDIYAVEIVIHNYSTVDKEEDGIEISIRLDMKTISYVNDVELSFDLHNLLTKTLKASEAKDDR